MSTFPLAIVTYEQLVQYFRTVATEHTGILHTTGKPHFFEFIDNEFTGKNIYDPALVLAPPRAQLIDNNSDNHIKQMLVDFWIVKSIAPGNFSARSTWFNQAEEIGFDIIARIEKEKKDTTAGAANRLWTGFEPASVQWEMIGPVGNLHWGYAFTFTVSNPRRLKYDEAKWS